ncbi:hypothetical protein D2Q93_04400 [Alicyclobacillaceae bacterium I2511]|nr:hypothetical protein D2Q93_04400 [Alicyclobacillaceae bacterium I2511]
MKNLFSLKRLLKVFAIIIVILAILFFGVFTHKANSRFLLYLKGTNNTVYIYKNNQYRPVKSDNNIFYLNSKNIYQLDRSLYFTITNNYRGEIIMKRIIFHGMNAGTLFLNNVEMNGSQMVLINNIWYEIRLSGGSSYSVKIKSEK